MTIRINNFSIFGNIEEANLVHIHIKHRRIQFLHFHLALQTLLRQTILQQLEVLVVLEFHHLLIVVLARCSTCSTCSTCNRSHTRSSSHRSHIHSTRSSGRRSSHDQSVLIPADDDLVGDVDELDGVHIMLQHRRVQTLLLHLHPQVGHALAGLLASEPFDVPHVVHTDHLRLAHVVHVQHILIQALLHHLLLHHIQRHAAAAVVEEPRVLGDGTVVWELLVQIARVQSRGLHLLLQRFQRLAQHPQVKEADVLRVNSLLRVTTASRQHEVHRGLERLLAQLHQLPRQVLRVMARHRRHGHALVERHVEAVRRDGQHEVGHLQQQLPHAPAAVRVVGDREHVTQDAREHVATVLLRQVRLDRLYSSRRGAAPTEQRAGAAQIDALHRRFLAVLLLAVAEGPVLLLDVGEIRPPARRRLLQDGVHHAEDVPLHEDVAELHVTAAARTDRLALEQRGVAVHGDVDEEQDAFRDHAVVRVLQHLHHALQLVLLLPIAAERVDPLVHHVAALAVDDERQLLRGGVHQPTVVRQQHAEEGRRAVVVVAHRVAADLDVHQVMHRAEEGLDDRNIGGVEGQFGAVEFDQLWLREWGRGHVEQKGNAILLEEELGLVKICTANHGVHFTCLVTGNGLLNA